MNQGIFGFPAPIDPDQLLIKQFDTSGSYTIPRNAKQLLIYAVGGGGGGGGGGRSTGPFVACVGGGGGGGGAQVLRWFLADDLGGPGATLTITIGAGGSSGSAAATDGATGGTGGTGGTTYVGAFGRPGYYILAKGGNAGVGGSTTGGGSAASNTNMTFGFAITQNGGSGASGTTIAGTNLTVNAFNNCGGAGGGGYSNPSGYVGGSIVAAGTTATSLLPAYYTRGATLAAGGSPNVATAPAHPRLQIFGPFSPGIGGPGGGGAANTGAGPGSFGYRGSGGGGGGASVNGIAAGAGGLGGNGYVCIGVMS